MKLLKLKFKNINSLAGMNEIDFTGPEFTHNRIFAITGKTGAGKSSILDAITLALYGRTPRVEITGQNNDVMTRGMNDCFSEVVFEVEGKPWKATWKQERKRTGNLKPVHRQIANGADEIITGKASECNGKIVEILGLTFEQFTKVVMLAQGGFAAFLQADKNEKGELLEQMTGTEIYGDISRKVFDRNKIEKEKLDKILLEIDAIKILSEEEISTLNHEMSECEKQKQQTDAELQSIETAKKWLGDLNHLQKQIHEAKVKLPGLEQTVETTKTAFEQAEAKLGLAKTEREACEEILKKVRELDIRISAKEQALKPVLDSLNKLENEIHESKKDLENKTHSLQNIETEISSNAKLLKQKNEELGNKKTELLHLLEGKQISDYHAEKEKISVIEKEIKNLMDSLKTNLSCQSDITNNEREMEKNSSIMKELSNNIKTDEGTAENLEKQIELLREDIIFLEKIKSLEEHRRSLTDGKKCPLCGSTEHPFAQGNVPQAGDKENELNVFKLEFKSLSKRIADNKNALTKIHSDNENAEKNIRAAQNLLDENKKKAKLILLEIHQFGLEIPEILDSPDCIASLDNIRKQEFGKYAQIVQKIQTAEGLEKTIGKLRDTEIPKIISEIDAKKNGIATLTSCISGLQTLIPDKEKQRHDKNFEKDNLEKERQTLSTERYDLFGDMQVEDEEKRLKELLEKAERLKTETEKSHTNANTELANHQAIINDKEKEWTEKQSEKITEKTLADLQNKFDEKRLQSGELSEKIGAIRQSLDTNDENLRNCGQKLKSRGLQQGVCNRWAALNTLIGSADGKTYRNFAQALTFEHLIGLTNIQLEKMSERYILKRVGNAERNPFELSVIDKFRNCEERTAQNLSGGEKFIVSLSLALGLANMASKNMKIDTMFIDEGFGTLDSDYLDVALSALSNLQNEGKLIGVISHLTELKERITTHVEVLPGGNGFSKIECKYGYVTKQP